MRFFTEQSVPEYCLVSEAALWISLGRVPECYFDDINKEGDESFVDYRRNEYELWDGDYIDPCDFILSSEFLAMGIDLDYKKYKQAAAGHKWKSGDQILEEHLKINLKISNMNLNIDHETNLRTALIRAKDDKSVISAAKSLDWARSIDCCFESIIEIGRSRIFDALYTGGIESEGFLFFTDEEMEQNNGGGPRNGIPGRFVSIPRLKWTRKNLSWDTSKLEAGDDAYILTQLKTEHLFKKFPCPLISALQLDGTVFGGTFVSHKTGGIFQVDQPKRGRPLKSKITFQDFLLSEFKRRQIAGELPEKREAIYAEATEWASSEFEHSLSRSAAQRYLKALWD